ncbi:MAG: hypothetical protein U0176_11610 [Bacteroidia bacterium]
MPLAYSDLLLPSVTVSDNEAPVITCPTNINVGTDAGQCTAVVHLQCQPSDNCAGGSLSQGAGLAGGAAFDWDRR